MRIEWIAVASAVAAWIAALQAYRSSRVARRAYRLAMEQETRLRPSLELYLVEAHVRRPESGARRLYVFSLTVSNKSDMANAIKHIRLIIEHSHGQGPISNIAIPHNPDLSDQLPGNDLRPFRVPCNIGARAVLGGSSIFEVPDDIFKDSRIEAYTLAIEDTYGHETSAEAIFLEERPL